MRVTYNNGKPVLPTTGLPKAPANSFAELQEIVLPGDTVHIQDLSGKVLRGVTTEITSSHLTIHSWDGQARPVTIRPSAVGRVELETTRTRTRAARGTLIGAGAGLGFTALMLATNCNDPDCGEVAPYALGMMGLIGAGIGFVSGLLSRSESIERHLVYERPESGWDVGFFPILSKDKKGAGVRVSF